MHVRMQRRWRALRVGRVYDLADGMANVLARRGIVVPVDQRPTETAIARAPESTRRRQARVIHP